MKDFAFHRPATIKDAVALLQSHGNGKFLAGGQSLLPVLKLELAEPSDLISLAGLKELRDIRVDGSPLAIGALTTHDQVSRSPEVQRAIPALARLTATAKHATGKHLAITNVTLIDGTGAAPRHGVNHHRQRRRPHLHPRHRPPPHRRRRRPSRAGRRRRRC